MNGDCEVCPHTANECDALDGATKRAEKAERERNAARLRVAQLETDLAESMAREGGGR